MVNDTPRRRSPVPQGLAAPGHPFLEPWPRSRGAIRGVQKTYRPPCRVAIPFFRFHLIRLVKRAGIANRIKPVIARAGAGGRTAIPTLCGARQGNGNSPIRPNYEAGNSARREIKSANATRCGPGPLLARLSSPPLPCPRSAAVGAGCRARALRRASVPDAACERSRAV